MYVGVKTNRRNKFVPTSPIVSSNIRDVEMVNAMVLGTQRLFRRLHGSGTQKRDSFNIVQNSTDREPLSIFRVKNSRIWNQSAKLL